MNNYFSYYGINTGTSVDLSPYAKTVDVASTYATKTDLATKPSLQAVKDYFRTFNVLTDTSTTRTISGVDADAFVQWTPPSAATLQISALTPLNLQRFIISNHSTQYSITVVPLSGVTLVASSLVIPPQTSRYFYLDSAPAVTPTWYMY